MKILVLCERVDSEGGTESYLRGLLPALAAGGDDVRVVARSVLDSGAYGVPSEAVAWSDEHDAPSSGAAARVSSIASSFAPDVAVAHNVLDAGVLRAAASGARRFAYHLHDHRPFCPNGDRLYPQGGGICGIPMSAAGCGFHSLVHGCAYGPRTRSLSLVSLREGVAASVRDADVAIAFSQYVSSLARRNGVPASRLHAIAPPLDDASFAGAPASRPAVDSVLFAGRVMPSKGLRPLISALSTLDVTSRPLLRIAGEGPDLAASLAFARERGVAFESLGRLDATALRRAYDAASVVAMPSTWGEPFGLVGIEAFARGRPVAAFDAGAISEWLSPCAGVCVACGDERALAQAIASLLVPERWAASSAAAFAAAQRYRMRDHVVAIRALYEGAA